MFDDVTFPLHAASLAQRWLPFAPIEQSWNLTGLQYLSQTLVEHKIWNFPSPPDLEQSVIPLVENGFLSPHPHFQGVMNVNPSFSLYLKSQWSLQSHSYKRTVMDLLHQYYHAYCYGVSYLYRQDPTQDSWIQHIQHELNTLIKLLFDSITRQETYNYLHVLSLYFTSTKGWKKYHWILTRVEQMIGQMDLASAPFLLHIMQGEVYWTHGNVLDNLRQPLDALQKLERACVIFEKIQRLPRLGQVLNSMGTVYFSLNNWTESLDFYEKALDAYNSCEVESKFQGEISPYSLFEPLHIPVERAKTQSNMGGLYLTLRQYELAADFFERARETYLMFQKVGELAAVEHNLGYLATEREDYITAIDWFQASISRYQSLNQLHPQGLIYLSLGNLYADQEVYDLAEKSYHQAIRIFISTSDMLQLAKVLQSMGRLQTDKSQLLEGLDYLTQALEIYESQQYELGIAEVCHTLGALHYFLQDNDTSQYYTLRAMEGYRSLGDETLYQQAKANLNSDPKGQSTGEE